MDQIQMRRLFVKQGYQDGKWRMSYYEAVGREAVDRTEQNPAWKDVSGDEEHERKYSQLKEAERG